MRLGVNTLFMIPGQVGGSETYLRRTLIAICGHCPDVRLILFTNIENDSALKRDLSEYPHVDFELLDFRAGRRFIRIIREQVELPIRARRCGVDVLWSPGYTAPLSCPCPQVVSILDMQYKSHPEDLTFAARLATQLLVTMAARVSDGIIALSDFSQKEIRRYLPVNNKKMKIVHGAVGEEFAEIIPNAKKQEIFRNLGVGLNNCKYILCVANTYPHKNIHTLIDAFRRVMNSIDHKLVLIGSPHLGERMVERAMKAIPDRDRIVRLYRISPQALIALYQDADLFVFPSLYEGFGLPILEAMMAGTLVVTTKMGAIPEVGGDKVIYAMPPDSHTLADRMLEGLSLSRERRKEMTETAKAYAAHFTWRQTAIEIVEFTKQFYCCHNYA